MPEDEEGKALSVKGKVTHINVKSDGTPNSAQLVFVVNIAFVVTSGYPPQVFSAMASVLSAAFNSLRGV